MGAPLPDTGAVAISVLLPTRDRPADLDRCVGSLVATTHERFEVVIIDQNAVPSTFDDPRVRVLRSTARGKSAALNEGAAVATGSILAFVDDDCTVDAGWLDHIESTFGAHPEVAMVFGNLEAAPHDTARFFVPTVEMGRFEVIRGAARAWIRGGAGANLSMRRVLFDQLGGFDPMIGPGAPIPACEEFDVYYRALAGGAAVARDPSSVVVHWGMRSLDDGAATRLLRDYHLGEGVVIGKHLRLRDGAMVLVGLRIVLQYVRQVMRRLIETRRLTGSGISGLAHLGRGIVRGLTVGVDSRLRTMRPID